MQYFPPPAFLCLIVCLCACVCLVNVYFFLLLTYRFSDYYFVLCYRWPVWWAFALLVAWLWETYYVVIACFVCVAEINILLPIYCTGWRPGNDCRTTVLYRLRSRHDERPSSVSDSKLHPRQLPCNAEVHAVLGKQDPVLILEGLLRTESHCAAEGERGHCQLCALQVAAVVLAVLRGIQVCWSESSKEWRHHCRQLDGSLRRWWPGTGAPRAIVPRDYRSLQQQVLVRPVWLCKTRKITVNAEWALEVVHGTGKFCCMFWFYIINLTLSLPLSPCPYENC